MDLASLFRFDASFGDDQMLEDPKWTKMIQRIAGLITKKKKEGTSVHGIDRVKRGRLYQRQKFFRHAPHSKWEAKWALGMLYNLLKAVNLLKINFRPPMAQVDLNIWGKATK